MVLTRLERPLTEDERRHLSTRMARARDESRWAMLKAGGASAVACGLLAGATILASDAPRPIILLFWAALWLLFTL